MTKREALDEAISEALFSSRFASDPDVRIDGIRKAIIAEMREPDDKMRRAWIVASCSDDFDPDQQEPVPGTGQGDLRYAPAWENMWDTLDCWKRHFAMFDAIE